MHERPILFTGAMIKAIRQQHNPKTQTRRVVKPQPVEIDGALEREYRKGLHESVPLDRVKDAGWWFSCPYGQPGDRLWVRETWAPKVDGIDLARPASWYAADFNDPANERVRAFVGGRWRPSIHMPRNRSRITLEITGVRVERPQDISEADALAEGIIYDPDPITGQGAAYWFERPDGAQQGYMTAREAYAGLWDRINGKRPGCAWADNPWVWVLDFRQVQL